MTPKLRKNKITRTIHSSRIVFGDRINSAYKGFSIPENFSMRLPVAALFAAALSALSSAALAVALAAAQASAEASDAPPDAGQAAHAQPARGDSREAVRSPDGRWLASVRRPAGEGSLDELWIADAAGRSPRRLLASRPHPEPQRNLTEFNTLAFSPDGRMLYFLTRAWVTSNALHRMALAGGEPVYLGAANNLQVVLRGRYTGYLVVQKHTYFKGGGSHEPYCLLTPSGRQVRELGDDERALEALLR